MTNPALSEFMEGGREAASPVIDRMWRWGDVEFRGTLQPAPPESTEHTTTRKESHARVLEVIVSDFGGGNLNPTLPRKGATVIGPDDMRYRLADDPEHVPGRNTARFSLGRGTGV